MKLSDISIKRPIGTIILAIALLVIGALGYKQLPVNMLPDITYPLIKVYVYWEGATPEQLENEVATIIERKISTVDNLDYIESTCEQGMYSLLVNFDYKANRDIAYQDVLSKMGLVRKDLPKDIKEPLIFKADPSQLPIIDLMITSDNMNLTQLRTWVENELQDQFNSIAGTAGTDVSGGKQREIRVNINQDKLQGYNIPVDLVIKRLKEENADMVGGRIITNSHDIVVRTYGQIEKIAELKNIRLTQTPTGATIFLKDVADIKDFSVQQKIRTLSKEKEGVKLSIFKQADANTVDVSDRVKKRLEELKNDLPASVNIEMTYDQAEYIRTSNKGVQDAVLIAAILVILVTGFFLSGFKKILSLIISMPVTILGTFFFMNLLHFSINIFTLGGLVVAMTVILDNVVVMLENITRIQEHEKDTTGQVKKGASQVSAAIVTATITFLALFLPFLFVPGLTSLLFSELVLTIAIVIGLSMIVSLTLTPALMGLFYPENKPAKLKKGFISKIADKIIDGILFLYKPILHWSLKLRWLVFIIFILLLIPGYNTLKKTGGEFLPQADDGLITLKVLMPVGTPMEQTDKVLEKVRDAIKDRPYIDKYTSLAGGRIWGLVTYENSYEGEVDIQLVPSSKRPMNTDQYVDSLKPAIMKVVKAPGAIIKIMHTKMKGIKMTGQFDIELEITAPRSEPLSKLFKTASEISKKFKEKDYLTAVDLSLRLNRPEYQIRIDRQKSMDLGLSLTDIGTAVKTMVSGNVPSYFKDGAYYYPIRVMISEKEITGQYDLENIWLFTSKGVKVPLNTVASVVQTVSPLQIDRKEQMRMIKVTANVQGKSVGEATELIKSDMAGFNLPAGYHLNYGGQSQMLSENASQIGLILLLALFLAYVVMVLYFESFIKPFIIIIRIPLSLAGMSFALYLTNTPLSVTAMIGVIMLSGIEINNGVLLLTFIDELRAAGETTWNAIVKAAMIRLRPILITDIVGITGLLPLAFTWGEGTEMLKPMAVVVMGGLIFGILMVFIFLPVVYLIVYGRQDKAKQLSN